MSRVAGSSIFTFQKVKRGHSMAQTGERLHSLLSYIHKLLWIVSAAFIRQLLTWISGYETLCFCAFLKQASWHGLPGKAWPSARPPSLSPPLPPEQAAVSSAHFLYIFVSIYIWLSLFFICLFLTRPQRWKQDTTEGETWRHLFAWLLLNIQI